MHTLSSADSSSGCAGSKVGHAVSRSGRVTPSMRMVPAAASMLRNTRRWSICHSGWRAMAWPSSFHCMTAAAFCMRTIKIVSRGVKQAAGSSA